MNLNPCLDLDGNQLYYKLGLGAELPPPQLQINALVHLWSNEPVDGTEDLETMEAEGPLTDE